MLLFFRSRYVVSSAAYLITCFQCMIAFARSLRAFATLAST